MCVRRMATGGEGPSNAPKKRLLDRLLPEHDPLVKEEKERERRVVKEQLGRSKFTDAIKSHNKDKLFLASADLVAAEPGNLFPALPLRPILGDEEQQWSLPEACAGAPATLVTVAFQGNGQMQLVPWHAAMLEALAPAAPGTPAAGSGQPSVRLVNVVFLQGWFWRFAAKYVAAGSARSLPEGIREATALAVEPSAKVVDHWCDKAGVHNRLMGFVFLLDAKGHVRWRAHGRPLAEELPAMVSATRLLVDAATGALKPLGRR